MSDCCNPAGYRSFFNDREARRSLRNYDKRGLDKMARSMVDFLISQDVAGKTVLEVGGGIGAIQVELMKGGAASAVNIELSEGYEDVATQLMLREGVSDRVERRVGDFTTVAPELNADYVVMNRVVCCYPFMERLMGAAVSSAERFVAATFPRERLVAKLGVSLGNTYCRMRGIDFRAFVHPPKAITDTAAAGGFEVAFHDRDLIWNAVVFERIGRA